MGPGLRFAPNEGAELLICFIIGFLHKSGNYQTLHRLEGAIFHFELLQGSIHLLTNKVQDPIDTVSFWKFDVKPDKLSLLAESMRY